MVDALPPVLASPPWAARRDDPEPVVVKGLKPPPPRAAWAPGEREEWASAAGAPPPSPDWEDALAQQGRGRLFNRHAQVTLFKHGPADRLVPLLAKWRPEIDFQKRPMEPIVARFGVDAVAPAVHAAKRRPVEGGPALLPFLDARVARLVAGWLPGRGDEARETARSWLVRHGVEAVPYLLPDALGVRESLREKAGTALRVLAAAYSPERVIEAAPDHGPAVAAIVAGVPRLDPGDPWLIRLVDPPAPVAWTDAPTLPPVTLGGTALAPETAAHLVTMLALSTPDRPFPGLAEVRAACEPGSLAAFAWALFERWEAAGAPPDGVWALTGLGVLGDDTTVRRLTPIIRAWPGQTLHHRAVRGLDVLAAIGTDTALAHLDGIARKVKFKALQAEAGSKIRQVAARLGLTDEQLADRLVPRFGLDGAGTLILDYGPRRFTVGFDEQLRPYVTDEAGRLRKSLPKPGAKDDPALAPAAHQRFADLKKDVRAVAAIQVRRLEAAMLTGRRWEAGEFREHLVGHPLLWHLVRRLVWTSGGVAFRVAEDGTFADVHDDAVTLAGPAAEVALVHPLHLGGDLAAWAEVFADYEILQPFPQLGRTVRALTTEESAAWRLPRFEGITVPTGALLALEKRGWERGAPEDNGTQNWIEYGTGSARVVLSLHLGIQIGDPFGRDHDTVTAVWITDRPSRFLPADGSGRTFAELEPVTASEIITDLENLTQST
ncbi:DUF4132 domain-containing protein [Actinomadura macra]|uniref:DUF4132 domain-containing protein n=1 Tax=Actinomadura macra TaxID=46164 RepID=UPI00082CFC0C|nr:DUF4132 domain-containing protein [Actinomadura macra]